MATEIERKFLIRSDGWRSRAQPGKPYRQGYIPTQNGTTVRVRVAGDRGFLTIKSQTIGLARQEFEYEIPVPDADEMLATLCGRPWIAKVRYDVPVDDLLWQVDVFEGENAGLVLAEVELDSPDRAIDLPDWLGLEVSGDARYFNSHLAQHPFSSW